MANGTDKKMKKVLVVKVDEEGVGVKVNGNYEEITRSLNFLFKSIMVELGHDLGSSTIKGTLRAAQESHKKENPEEKSDPIRDISILFGGLEQCLTK